MAVDNEAIKKDCEFNQEQFHRGERQYRTGSDVSLERDLEENSLQMRQV